jgi:hypothetical protein
MKKFWIVAKQNQFSQEPYGHSSFEEAQKEAIRLSHKDKGETFYVFECVGSALTETPTKWTPFR